jgi:hypothetical protein
MTNQIIENYLADVIQSFRNYKKLADKSIEQVSDDEFFCLIDAEANSIAIIVKHISGNLRSRWSDFLTADGEKPDRNRDDEFVSEDDTRESLLVSWEKNWQILFDSIEPLTVEDFAKTITIRGQKHTICEAINRQSMHYAYHIGQIALLAKHFRSENWQTLSVAKNKSAAFNRFMAENSDDKRKQVELAQEFSEKM